MQKIKMRGEEKRHLEVGKQVCRQYAFYSSLGLGVWYAGFHFFVR